jgi:hypothetical protein
MYVVRTSWADCAPNLVEECVYTGKDTYISFKMVTALKIILI